MTLGDEYPLEQARLRELKRQYESIGPAGAFGLHFIKEALADADRAAISGDLAEMIQAFKAMKECQ